MRRVPTGLLAVAHVACGAMYLAFYAAAYEIIVTKGRGDKMLARQVALEQTQWLSHVAQDVDDGSSAGPPVDVEG